MSGGGGAPVPAAAGAEPAIRSRPAPPGERSRGHRAGMLRRLRRDPVAIACAAVLLLMLLAIVFAPLLAPHDPYQGGVVLRLRPIGTPGHPLGTDELGRDVLSRLLHGGRLSWFIGVLPVALAFCVGTGLGVLAGYAGGRANTLVMRATDVFCAFPSVLLAVAVSGALGAGVSNAVLALTLAFVPPVIRVAESATRGVRDLDFVDAARASGASGFTVVRAHVLGNVLGPVFVHATSLVPACVILASGLSFLGLGAEPPESEWGLMLNTPRAAIHAQPWVALLPGACIFATSACFNLLSDGLRRAMDAKG